MEGSRRGRVILGLEDGGGAGFLTTKGGGGIALRSCSAFTSSSLLGDGASLAMRGSAASTSVSFAAPFCGSFGSAGGLESSATMVVGGASAFRLRATSSWRAG